MLEGALYILFNRTISVCIQCLCLTVSLMFWNNDAKHVAHI